MKGKIALLHAQELDLIRRANNKLVVVVIHKAKCVEPRRPNCFRSVAA